MRLISSLTVILLSLSLSGAALAQMNGDGPGKIPGDKMHQLKPGMLRMPNPAPWVKVTLDAAWLHDAHSHDTMPNASGVLSGPQFCPVSLGYKATIVSTTLNVTAAVVLNDGTMVAVNMPTPGPPKSGNYTFRLDGFVDFTKEESAPPGKGFAIPLKTVQAHLQILTPKPVDPASTTSSQSVTMTGATCSNVVCTIDGCGFAK